MQGEGLAVRYAEDERLSMAIKSMIALSFMPPDDIPDAFQELRGAAPPETEAIFDYFAATYVLGTPMGRKKGRPKRGAARPMHPPRFPPALWSIHELQQLQYGRTNNKQEGWHRRFQTVVQRHHLGLFPFIYECRKEQHRTELQLTRVEGRQQQPSRPRAIVERENRLQAAFEDYGRVSTRRFLRRIARNLEIRTSQQVRVDEPESEAESDDENDSEEADSENDDLRQPIFP